MTAVLGAEIPPKGSEDICREGFWQKPFSLCLSSSFQKYHRKEKKGRFTASGGLRLLLFHFSVCFSVSWFLSSRSQRRHPSLSSLGEENCLVPSAGTLLSCSLSHFQIMKSWREKLVWESHLKQVLPPEGKSSHNWCYQACQKYF